MADGDLPREASHCIRVRSAGVVERFHGHGEPPARDRPIDPPALRPGSDQRLCSESRPVLPRPTGDSGADGLVPRPTDSFEYLKGVPEVGQAPTRWSVL